MDVAADAAWLAGKLTLGYFQRQVTVDTKADRTPVTIADREAEQFLADFLLQAFPDDGILGEEFGERSGSSGYRWVVDPIDGTRSFVRGVPLYGVLVGLEDPKGEPVVGAVCFPALGDLVVAGRGEGCFWNGRRVRVSTVADLSEACVAYTDEECSSETGTLEVCRKVRERVGVVRGWGDCYGHVLVATGRVEAMLDPVLADWDCVALLPVVEEAGGVFTDWRGQRTARGKSAVSTNAALGAQLRELIAEP